MHALFIAVPSIFGAYFAGAASTYIYLRPNRHIFSDTAHKIAIWGWPIVVPGMIRKRIARRRQIEQAALAAAQYLWAIGEKNSEEVTDEQIAQTIGADSTPPHFNKAVRHNIRLIEALSLKKRR